MFRLKSQIITFIAPLSGYNQKCFFFATDGGKNTALMILLSLYNYTVNKNAHNLKLFFVIIVSPQ